MRRSSRSSSSSSHKLKQAQERLQSGDVAGARALCDLVLQHAPRNPQALTLLGISHLMSGQPAAAVPVLERVLADDPQLGIALEHLGLAHLMLGQFPEAERALRRAAALNGAPASVAMRLGIALLQQRKHEAAIQELRRALALEPQNVDCHLNLGQALAQVGDTPGARDHFHAILRLAPGHPDAAFNLGVMALERDELDEARQWFERALGYAPQHVAAMINLGAVLQRQSRLDEAAACLRKALTLEPANAAARNNLARTLALQGRLAEARECYLETLRLNPHFTAAHEGMASVCLALGRTNEAIGHLQATLEAEPDNHAIVSALAGALFEVGKLEEAEGAARRASTLDPSSASAYATLANISVVRGDLARAIAALESGYAQTGDTGLLGMLTYQLRQGCDWTKWQAAWARMAPEIERDSALGSPFWLLCEPTTALQQLGYTRRWAQSRFGTISSSSSDARGVPREHRRLRVGYLSSDLQEHAAAYLIAEVLELHDRERFEVFAYSHGPDDQGTMRPRLRAACEHFLDIAWEPDDVAAERIRQDELDILVDLKGYTAGDRLTIMARRPCEMQVTWLGYPGTTGASFIDCLIADAFIIPPGREAAYSERIVRMPHCYQPNDRKRVVGETLPRSEYGIREGAFVFCCFNQAYKITPDVFGVWMELMRSVPDSLLWLIESNRLAKHNLLEAARARGVAADRLVFAPRLPYARHLARYRVADLALDTFPYTSHTILSDALWCGCPTVGLCGETFASRVSGSLLTAAGLPDMVTHALPDYQRLAYRLATDAALLLETRARVARARDNSPLFDSTGFARDLECLYASLVEATQRDPQKKRAP
jgi:predicted O-linked N-acetylglucosamine transferase (SPINDLY family)